MVHALIRELEEVRERANEKVSPPSYTVRSPASQITFDGPVVSVDAADPGSGLWFGLGQCREPDQTPRRDREGGYRHSGEVEGQ